MIDYPKYIKSADGQIGRYAYNDPWKRPVYRYQNGSKYIFKAAAEEELLNGSNSMIALTDEKDSMQWKQLSLTIWEAVGKYGKFRIEHSRGKFWSHYASNDTAFKMPPKAELSEAKAMRERNTNWEDVV